MYEFRRALLGCVLFLVLPTVIYAQESEAEVPDPVHGHNWKEVARKEKLDAKQIEQLGKNKILVTNTAFKQVFTPYVGSNVPLFITSDSLLNGFHVLYEESIFRLEEANARKLGSHLQFIWGCLQTADKAFKGKPQLVAAAKKRAQIVMATAMRLLGEEPTPLDASTSALVNEEVKRIEAGEGQQKPKWLGPPDPGFMAVDYTRYKPRGLYVKTPSLQRYFRAVSWLQSIPFRASNDEEFVSILILSNGVAESRNYDKLKRLVIFLQTFHKFVGPGDDLSLLDLFMAFHGKISLDDDGGLASLREDVLPTKKHREAPQINDQLALPPDDSSQAAEYSYRIIAAHRTPDAMLFQQTTDPRKSHHDFPNGLEICAMLGSSYARSRLAAEEKDKLMAEIGQCKARCLSSTNTTLYARYLNCLEALVAKPEPNAPPFMSSEAWQMKSCQTVLGGWAQLRHTWILHVKQNVAYLGIGRTPSGFVEPIPEFFARMALLAEESEIMLKKAEAITADLKKIAADIRTGANLLRKKTQEDKMTLGIDEPSEETTLAQNARELSRMLSDSKGNSPSEVLSAETYQKLCKLADDLDRGQLPDNLMLAETIQSSYINIADLWRSLGGICRRLESLAHKQLRGVAFNEEEKRFIMSYGDSLAQVMLYGGNSYLDPKDDAPRVVDVFSNPRVGKHLEVGIARARDIYVLYPVQGGEILCRGAVMPYYEFTSDTRLTDATWKSLLDSPQRPKLPDWIGPIITPEGLSAPTLESSH